MNLFWKRIFGQLKSTFRFELEIAQIQEDLQHYLKVEESVELADYNELLKVVNTVDFKEKKKTLENRKYKDTEEYRDTHKFNTLQNKGEIQLYYQVLESKELKDYLNFKQTADFYKLENTKLVSESDELKRLKSFEQSEEYKVYTRLYDSYVIKEFELLKTKISSIEFKKANDFWANQNRWQTTPEYAQEVRFNELSQNKDIVFYLKTKPERFDKYRSLTKSFEENFDWNTLSKSNWDFGFHYKDPVFIGNHSFTNEKQANNSGKNVSVVNGILGIVTKQETVKARAWDTKKGFVENEFEYTSDIIQSSKQVRQKYGIFQAKVRCLGKINHVFALRADKKEPLIKIFHYNGKTISVGSVDKNSSIKSEITGLNPSDFYVYTLVWTEKELVWMINNMEVFRTTNNVPHEEMYLSFNSFISEKQDASVGNLEVDWVRVYR